MNSQPCTPSAAVAPVEAAQCSAPGVSHRGGNDGPAPVSTTTPLEFLARSSGPFAAIKRIQSGLYMYSISKD